MTHIVSGNRRISLAEVAEHAARAASGFVAEGIGADDVILLFLRNDFAFFEASYAASLIGAYSTPANWHSTPDEAKYLIEDSRARAIVAHADLLETIRHVIPSDVKLFVVPTPEEIASAYPAEVQRILAETDWLEWLSQFEPWSRPPETNRGSMIYTSGTTGFPKGVKRQAPTSTQASELAEAVATVMGYGRIPGDIVVAVAGPMYHSAPNAQGLFAGLAGAAIILLPKFDAETLLQSIEEHRVTHLHLVPVMFSRLLALPEATKRRYDLSSLRYVVHAAAPCPPDIKRRMIDWWGPIIHEYYGTTETSALVHCDSGEWLAHPGTVGKALPHCRLSIRDEAGQALPAGEVGEVAVQTPTLAEFTYFGDQAKRDAMSRDGWVMTGDAGYLDDDGFLYICDRLKDMIISGGVNIYPAEIEAVAGEIDEIQDCAVFGVPDAEFGESVCLAVQLRSGRNITADAIMARLRQRLAGYKLPRLIEFHDDLPRQDSGKIFKRKLRARHWEGAGRRI